MMKGQKGITLVALVITIIVMLILVGVTISVAMNGGLFEKADTAAQDTRKAQLSEAVALAKAEILTDFYSAKTEAARVKPIDQDEDADTKDVKSLIQSYLGDTTFEFSVAATATGYTVTTTNPDYIDPITMDLTGVGFFVAPADPVEPDGNGDA